MTKKEFSAESHFTYLGSKDPIWVVLLISSLPLIFLIYYQLTYSPIYVPLEIHLPNDAGKWSLPEGAITVANGDHPLINRYYIWHRELDLCTDLLPDPTWAIREMDQWALDNGWQTIDDLKISPCEQYADADILTDQRVDEWLTYKPRGWDDSEAWTTTLCIGAIQEEECAILVLETVSFSFWTELSGRLR